MTPHWIDYTGSKRFINKPGDSGKTINDLSGGFQVAFNRLHTLPRRNQKEQLPRQIEHLIN
jgi:hypothetical protein